MLGFLESKLERSNAAALASFGFTDPESSSTRSSAPKTPVCG